MITAASSETEASVTEEAPGVHCPGPYSSAAFDEI